MTKRVLALFGALSVFSVSAFAISVDGQNIPVDFLGGVSAYQASQTGFGDNQSEADGLFLASDTSNLYVGLTGNIEQGSGNRIVIVLDTKAGGVTSMPANMGFLSGQDHLNFAGGFAGDYAISMNIFGGIAYVDLFDLQSNSNNYLGGVVVNGPGGWDAGQGGSQLGTAAFDNTNVLGVSGGNGLDLGAATATTGFEGRLAFSDLGIAPGTRVCSMAYITSGNGYFANQFLPTLGPSDNRGFDTVVIDGYLCHTVVPEPGSIAAIGVALSGFALRLRRK